MIRLRSIWKSSQDLELRLGQSQSQERRNSAPNAPIELEDDDDEVQVLSARPFAHARSSMSTWNSQFTIINEEDLELRLGFAGTSTSIGMIIPSTHRIGRHDHNTNSSNDTIDLTIPNDECELIGSTISKKTRPAPSVGSKEIKLACAICMDTMQEETSTICGHIFCKKCIMSAIRAQKKCPTCRRKLTNSNIHRIYLSGSTS